ncbi:GAF and ANTAR domain-containing protein [Crossiella cryophila]|uniref:GAF domain-containing protein n=1 Tax=Crossiella cryophila TaxID=43355 RepID=A0A7W7CCC9_9PSEU|nr:GAF and ANTAR domain-containing protein [Crossiella cryophila]MBB4678422.1 GAF domain-containing protein [Crossiella cryophila]
MLDRRVAQTFVELADTLVLGFDTIDFLHTLTERCVELLEVDAVGILLVDQRGALNLVAASTEQARMLELFQLQDEEGPCLDCFRTGLPVGCPDLGAEPQRWPRFSVAAGEQGFAAVQAVPMRLREEVIGALNLFGSTAGGISAEAIALAQSFANVATISILQVRALRHSEMVAEQLQTALNSRIMIEQAKGILTERLQIGIADAFALMRNHARGTNQFLSDVAQQVISRSPEVADLLKARPPRPGR